MHPDGNKSKKIQLQAAQLTRSIKSLKKTGQEDAN
jgi:hypothetical protein